MPTSLMMAPQEFIHAYGKDDLKCGIVFVATSSANSPHTECCFLSSCLTYGHKWKFNGLWLRSFRCYKCLKSVLHYKTTCQSECQVSAYAFIKASAHPTQAISIHVVSTQIELNLLTFP